MAIPILNKTTPETTSKIEDTVFAIALCRVNVGSLADQLGALREIAALVESVKRENRVSLSNIISGVLELLESRLEELANRLEEIERMITASAA